MLSEKYNGEYITMLFRNHYHCNIFFGVKDWYEIVVCRYKDAVTKTILSYGDIALLAHLADIKTWKIILEIFRYCIPFSHRKKTLFW